MRKLLFITLSFTFSLLAFSQASFSQDLEEKTISALTEDFLELRKELSRDIKTYHWLWYNDNSYNYYSRSEAIFQYFFTPRATRIFDNPQLSNFGDGLYSTLDPQNSKDYGNFLLEVSLKKGSFFLDFRGADYKGFEIRKSTANLLNEYCAYSVEQPDSKTYTRNNKIYVSVLRNTLSTTPKCNEIFVKAITDTEVDFIAYTWMPDGTRMYGTCTSRVETSFVIIGKTKVLSSETQKLNLTATEYSTFLSDNGYVDADATEDVKNKSRAYAEHHTGLFQNKTAFSAKQARNKSVKIYMDKFRNRATVIKREFVTDYSNIEVKGFSSHFSYNNIKSSNKQSHHNDYLFVDQFSRLAKTQDGKPPKALWNDFSSYTDYLDMSSSINKEVESSRFNCRQDIYPEDKVIDFKAQQ